MTASVKHTVRSTLVVLGAGVVLQRLCQLLGFVLIGRALGIAGLGTFAEGQALAAVLTVFAGAGVRSLTARTLAGAPTAARDLLLTAVRRRLLAGLALALPAGVVAFAHAQHPWFWCWSLLLVLPAAFDMKQLLDTSGRTRREVHIESAVALLQLCGVLGWFLHDAHRPDVLAAIVFGSRCLYALGAIGAILALPETGPARAHVPRDTRARTSSGAGSPQRAP